ncbi:MAG: tetratricopeptide repeat protein [Acidobacteriaceae bacterium]
MSSLRLCRTAALCVLALCLGNEAFPQSANDSFQSIEHAADSARDAGNAEEAIRDYTRALALRPGWAQGWWELGALQYQASRYADAIRSLHHLTALAPNAAQGWAILGLSEFETKDYGEALSSLEKAQKLGGVPDPDITRVAAYHLALLLIRSGDFDRATAVLHSTFGNAPPAQARVALGLALLRVPLLPSEVDPSKDALVHAAGEAAASADPQQALAALIQQYPKIPWLHYGYGRALATAGHLQNALTQQKLETSVFPQNPLPWLEIRRLSLQLEQPGEAAIAARRAARLTSAARRDPRMIARYTAQGAPAAQSSKAWSAAMQDYSAEKYPEAIAALKAWVEKNPEDGTAWAVMGLSEFAQKDYENARIHLQRGINLGVKGSPESLQLASERLALLLIRDGQFDAATSLLRPLAPHPTVAPQVELALGLALLHISTLPDRLSPNQRSLAQSCGAIVEMLFVSRYSEAFPAFQKLIAENPTTPWLHYAYGDALDSLSRYDDAKAQMNDELKLSPHSALPWIRLASISLRQHLPADALRQAQTAVAVGPRSAEAHYQLGRAWLESGDAYGSIAELEKANALKPNTPEIHFALARAYAKDHQPQKAAAERATFIQLKSMAAQSAQSGTPGGSVLNTDEP